jgi:hypothetical protein
MKYCYLIIAVSLLSCLQPEPQIPDPIPEINLATAYPTTETELNITGNLIVNTLKNNVEYGIVWSDKANPIITDQHKIIGSINAGIQFNTKIGSLISGSTIFVKAYFKNSLNKIVYSNEISVKLERLYSWYKMENLPIKEGQFTGVATKIDDHNLFFLRLDQNNNWELWEHYNGIYNDPDYTWRQQQFRWTQVSPRLDPLFFTVNFNQDYTRPAAFLGGGYITNPRFPNLKTYVKDMYWVYDAQNYTDPIPLGDGPIAHFTLNRKEFMLEENNTNNVWSYFALEPYIKLKPFPKLSADFHFMGVSTAANGYILAEKKDGTSLFIFEYDEIKDTWTQKTNFPGKGRIDGTAFTLNNKVYYGLGRSTSPILGFSDIWEFNPLTNTWKYISNYPGAGNVKVMTAGLGDYAVFFCGYQVRDSGVDGEKYYSANDTWRFAP